MFHCHCANLLKLECKLWSPANRSYQNQFVLLQKPVLLHGQKHVFRSSCSQDLNKGYKESNGIPFLLCLEYRQQALHGLFPDSTCSYPACAHAPRGKQSVLSVCQFVCQSSEKFWKLNIDRVKQFLKVTVDWNCNKRKAMYFIGSKAVLLCFSSCFLFNVRIVHHFQYLGYGRVQVYAD